MLMPLMCLFFSLFIDIFRRHKTNKAQKLAAEKKQIKMVHRILKYRIQLYPVHNRPVML